MVTNQVVLAYFSSTSGWNPKVDRTLPLLADTEGVILIDPRQVHQIQHWSSDEQFEFGLICQGLTVGYQKCQDKILVNWLGQCLEEAGITYARGFFENTHIPQLCFCEPRWHSLLADHCKKQFGVNYPSPTPTPQTFS